MIFKLLKILLVFYFSSLSSVVYADDCFILYKAKKDNPLKLHLGLIKINGPCLNRNIETIISSRLNPSGWLLLKIVNISESIEAKKMERELGDYFLKY